MKQIKWLLVTLVLASLALALNAPAENEALYTPNGRLYVPHVNLLDGSGNTVHSYAAYLQKDSRAWKFKLYGLSEVSTNTATTNTTTNVVVVSTNLAGTWDFSFNEYYPRTFDGTNFSRGTNGVPVTTNIVLTLFQTNHDVTGTGTISSIRYSLSGELTNNFFAFDMLGGTTNSMLTLTAGRATLGNGEMEGDYLWSTTNATRVGLGTFSATKR